MTIEQRREVYENAAQKWGLENQVIVCIEELSELQKELTKFLRGFGNDDRLADEIADVRITVEEMVYYFGNAEEVAAKMDEKVKRLEGRL